MRFIPIFVLGALIASGTAAHAADCANAATQMAMNACAGEDFQAADARLNEVYRDVAGRLRGEDAQRARLAAAETAWIKFRDTECDFATGLFEGGSILPTLVSQCQAKLTTERTKQLQAYLRCREGDLGCPVPPR